MTVPARHRSVAALALVGLLATGCGDDDDTAGGAGTSASTSEVSGGGAGAEGLADVCPDPFVIQTDWFPEAEHGALYQMLGEDYRLDSDAKTVSGPLIAGGEDTGLTLEIRSGGAAIGGTVAATTYTDESITLAYANTESQVRQHDETPLVSVVAPLEINPQIIYWDPETYPDVETLADLGEQGITINVFAAGVFSEVFVADGTWSADQVDPSYDASPARFISEDGAIAQQGFASAEPYLYEHDFEEWGRPVAYQTLHDAGFQVYSQTLAARPADLEELAPCLERFVPIAQQATIDYVHDPDDANDVIIDAVAKFDTFWTYDQGVADYSVETQRQLGLVGNGPDDTLGDIEAERVQRVIDQMRDAGLDVPAGLEATDLFTNEFIDPGIGL